MSPARIHPRAPARLVQEHERQKTLCLDVVHKTRDEPGQSQDIAAKLSSDQFGARGRSVAFVEDQVEHMQDTIQPLWHFCSVGNEIGWRRVADARFSTDDTLRDRGRTRKERACDLFGCQPADLAQRQGDAGVLS